MKPNNIKNFKSFEESGLLDNTKLKATYGKDETPEERLRNKLSPFFLLVSIMKNKSYDDPKMKQIIENTVKACEDNIENIKDYLSDISIFYKNDNEK